MELNYIPIVRQKLEEEIKKASFAKAPRQVKFELGLSYDEVARYELAQRPTLDEFCAHWAHQGHWPEMGALSRVLLFERLLAAHALASQLGNSGFVFVDGDEKLLRVLLIDYWTLFGLPRWLLTQRQNLG